MFVLDAIKGALPALVGHRPRHAGQVHTSGAGRRARSHVPGRPAGSAAARVWPRWAGRCSCCTRWPSLVAARGLVRGREVDRQGVAGVAADHAGLPIGIAVVGAPAWEIVAVIALVRAGARQAHRQHQATDRRGELAGSIRMRRRMRTARAMQLVTPLSSDERTNRVMFGPHVTNLGDDDRRFTPAAHRVLRRRAARRLRHHRDRGRQRARQRLAVRASAAGRAVRRRVGARSSPPATRTARW